MALVLALTLFGGLTFAARSREKSLKGWLCCILVGWFSGVVTHMILTELFPAVTPMTAAALSSASASTGGLYLDSVMSNLTDLGTGAGHKPGKNG